MNLHKVNTFIIQRGMRVAQLLIEPVVQPTLKEITMLTVTPRGTGGFRVNRFVLRKFENEEICVNLY